MKLDLSVQEISKAAALDMVRKYHYSNTLPRLNKIFLGFFQGGELVGVITLGYGVRPLHTIKKLFPSLGVEDYLEIGRMCMADEMQRTSESQMLAACIKWLKANRPNVKILFTFADGMLGKCGYVYQASSFIYAGPSPSEIYLLDGYKIHPRQTAGLFKQAQNDKRVTARPTLEQQKALGIRHYRGKQYRYFRFLCCKTLKTKLLHEALFDLHQQPPKDKDLSWRVQDQETGRYIEAGRPPYKTDFNAGYGLQELKKRICGKREGFIRNTS